MLFVTNLLFENDHVPLTAITSENVAYFVGHGVLFLPCYSGDTSAIPT
jgi:hypothetical protein